MTLLILNQPLIVPMVFHVLINGQDAHRKCIQSGNHADDQSLGRSCVRFPQSHAVKSRACLRAFRSCDELCARLHGGDFPGSRG